MLAISVELDLSAAEARVADKVRATTNVTNGGAARLSGITVELRVDAAGLRIQGASTTIITRLQPGRTSDSTWTICALQPGNYLVLATATLAGVSIDSLARLLSISGERRRGCA